MLEVVAVQESTRGEHRVLSSFEIRIRAEAAMDVRHSILCPIDYSDASAGALQYAAAIAGHFGTRVVVLGVEDPLLTTAMDLGTGGRWTHELSEHEITKFLSSVFGDNAAALAMCERDVAVGKPPVEILRVARERSSDLIVMSSHGLTGARKLFFGSTTERVLRETTVPVLVTPPANRGPIRLNDVKHRLGRIIVPVDLSPASLHQTQVAGRLAEALHLPLLLVHVIEPVRSALLSRLHLAGLDSNRRAIADEGLDRLVSALPAQLPVEALVVFGDPAEEAVKVMRDRRAGLVVMGLHGSPLLGPRMGSVTYRMVCLSPAVVLALPPVSTETVCVEIDVPAQVPTEATA